MRVCVCVHKFSIFILLSLDVCGLKGAGLLGVHYLEMALASRLLVEVRARALSSVPAKPSRVAVVCYSLL